MNDEQFQKELAKYKIVRRADHHKIRDKKRQVTVPKSAPAATAPTAKSPARAAIASGPVKSFWSLLESTISKSGVLTHSETEQFIQKLKAEQSQVFRQVNLDDLNAIVQEK